MSRLCCRPADFEEDRTHHVSYSQQSWEDGVIRWEDTGSEVACSHNDAILTAELMAGRFDNSMKPRGKHGTWIGSELVEGEGTRVHVWVSRGPGDEDYDAARRVQQAEEERTWAGR